MLASGVTFKETAKRVKCNERSISLWKKQPAFLEAIEQAEDDLYADALRLLKKSMKPAITTLLRNLEAKTPYVQVAAASKLIDSAMEVHSLQSLEQRLQAVEDLARGDDGE